MALPIVVCSTYTIFTVLASNPMTRCLWSLVAGTVSISNRHAVFWRPFSTLVRWNPFGCSCLLTMMGSCCRYRARSGRTAICCTSCGQVIGSYRCWRYIRCCIQRILHRKIILLVLDLSDVKALSSGSLPILYSDISQNASREWNAHMAVSHI